MLTVYVSIQDMHVVMQKQRIHHLQAELQKMKAIEAVGRRGTLQVLSSGLAKVKTLQVCVALNIKVLMLESHYFVI